MGATLTRLYPTRSDRVPVRGLYLAHRLHELANSGLPFVYADFVTSLDARIALFDASGVEEIPPELKSQTDLRLLLELHAQADCLVTNAGYLRSIAGGSLDDILQVGTVAGHGDLAAWREANGLRPQPAVCIASASLEFALPASLQRCEQQVIVATGRKAPGARIDAFAAAGCDVVIAGRDRNVEGGALVEALGTRGLRSAFLLAGPRMLDTMLRDRVLSRLYVTITHQLLGGERYRSLLEGPAAAGAGRLALSALYLDASRADGPNQFFAQFEPEHTRPTLGDRRVTPIRARRKPQ